MASYKIGFDDGTEDFFEHPATEVEVRSWTTRSLLY